MIADALFVLVLAAAVITGRKKGFVNIIMGLVSGILSLVLLLGIRTAAADNIKKTPAYISAKEKICEQIEENYKDNIIVKPFVNKDDTADAVAEKMTDACLSALVFLALFILIRTAGAIINAIFHLPVLRRINGLVGCLWSAAAVVLITYMLLAAAGQMSLIYKGDFFEKQMESSVIIKNMYENNILLAYLTEK